MFCENCGTKVEDGALFCPNCGARVEPEEEMAQAGEMEEAAKEKEQASSVQETAPKEQTAPDDGTAEAKEQTPPVQEGVQEVIFCANCGTENAASAVFCASCGSPLHAQNVSGAAGSGRGTKKKLPGIIAGIVCAGAAAALIFFVVNLLSGGGELKDTQLLYLKDETLYKATYQKLEPVELAEDVIDRDYAEGGIYSSSNVITAQYSEDHKYLFFIKQDYDDSTLYYLDLKDKDAEPEKLDSGEIYHYELLSGNKLLYLKDDTLYLHDMDDKEKIASGIQQYFLSEDENKVLWMNMDDGRMYYCGLKGDFEKEKLDSEVSGILYENGDFSKIVYRKESDIYIMSDLEDKDKVISDADTDRSIRAAETDGGIQILYYEDGGTDEMTLSDFVTDDMKAQDDAITEPDIKDYQTQKTVQGFWGTRIETETDDEYYVKEAEYEEKRQRDYLREELSYQSVNLSRQTLKLYDEKTDDTITLLKDNYSNDAVSSFQIGGTLAAFTKYVSEEEFPSYVFSDIVNGNVSESEIWDSLSNMSGRAQMRMICGMEVYQPFGDQIFDENNFLSSFYADSDGEALYAILCEDGDSELVQFSVSGSDAGSYETLYEDAERIFACKNGKIFYGVELDSDEGICELYCNDESIADDVSYYYTYQMTENDSFLYYTDIDRSGAGTLWLYNGGKPQKVAGDVNYFCYVDDKKIALLTDVSSSSGLGDLKVYNGKETKKVDTDVQCIIIPRE